MKDTQRRAGGYRTNRKLLLATATHCAVCHLPGTADEMLTAGHIVALANGGTNDLENLQPEHMLCNLSRGAREWEPPAIS